MRALLRLAQYVWASPLTLFGLVVAGFVLLAGGTLKLRNRVVEVLLASPRSLRWWPFDAITLGHVILARDESRLGSLRAHELVHVRQYERWGPLFALAYPLSSLLQVIRGRDPYHDNHFEVEARRLA